MIIDEAIAQLTILKKEKEIDNVTLSGKLQEANDEVNNKFSTNDTEQLLLTKKKWSPISLGLVKSIQFRPY